MLAHKEVSNKDIERFNPSIQEGLTTKQVNQRISEKLVNKTTIIVGKTTWEILRTNVFTFFNILLFVIAGFMIYANVNDADPSTPWYQGLFFVGILISNIIIGLVQDFRTKHLMVKMSILNKSKILVIRNGKEEEIDSDDLVVDDLFILKSGDQIATDSVIVDGYILADESCITGESRSIPKDVGSTLYSGSIVSSGRCIAKVEKVGKENSIEALTIKAKAVKRNPSHILKSLRLLFRILCFIIIILSLVIVVTYSLQGSFSSKLAFINTIRPFSGQFVAMIPAGLSLLTSVALVSGVISLYNKGAYVQELYSIEMLARSDVLCVDKTGTITSGNMNVVNIDLLGKESVITEAEISTIIANILSATGDSNVTANALKKHFQDYKSDIAASKVLPFSSDNKYSGATFASGVTYLIGAFEKMNIETNTKNDLKLRISEWANKGYRVLLSGKGSEEINGDSYHGLITPMALIILEDEIKKDAAETFDWFKNNGVAIKVVSGDNLQTVTSIAKAAGIEGAEKGISLEDMSLEEVKKIANDYTVFCRVSPEQKEMIVTSLKEAGKTVAMTGDGINDILALKHADCSIAMNSGSQAAKNVSHVVLKNDNFSAMPSIVSEGRRVINNLTRTGSLFLTKTLFAIVLSIVFWIVSLATNNQYSYPFSTNNMLIWEVFGIGLSAFFVALEPNSTPIKHGFLRNILKRAIPGAILIITSVLICYLLYILQIHGIMYTGISSFGYSTMNSSMMRYGATGVSVLTFSALSFAILYIVCRPLSKYRAAVLMGAMLVTTIIYIVTGITSPSKNILGLNFDAITYENIVVVVALSLILAAIIIFIQTIIYNLKKDGKRK